MHNYVVTHLADQLANTLLGELKSDRSRRLFLCFSWCFYVLVSGKMPDLEYWIEECGKLLDEG